MSELARSYSLARMSEIESRPAPSVGFFLSSKSFVWKICAKNSENTWKIEFFAIRESWAVENLQQRKNGTKNGIMIEKNWHGKNMASHNDRE